MSRRRTVPLEMPPPLDLVPVLGLTAVLIPMLLLGQVEAIATVDTHLPGF